MSFTLKELFTSEAIYSETFSEFVYRKLEPAYFPDMFCSYCGENINELKLIENAYTTQIIEDFYYIENNDYQVAFNLTDLEKHDSIYVQAEEFFERILDYEGDFRALRCTIDDKLISVYIDTK